MADYHEALERCRALWVAEDGAVGLDSVYEAVEERMTGSKPLSSKTQAD